MLPALFVTLGLFAATPSKPAASPDVVATVNGVPIRRALLDASLQAARANPMLFGAPLPSSAKDMTGAVLDQLISAEVLAQESKARGISIPDADIDASVKEMRSHFGSDAEWQQTLTDHHFSEKDVREDARRQLAIKKLLEQDLLPKVPVVDEKTARAYYDANPRQFLEPEEIRIAHILVIVDADFDATRKKAARAKIEKALASARKKGKDFAALAKAVSEDEGSKDRGGDVGFVRDDGEWPPEFVAAAMALKKKGEISGIVETRQGLHVLKLLDRLAAHPLPFDDKLKGEIVRYLDHQRQSAAALEYVDGLKMKAKIEFSVPR